MFQRGDVILCVLSGDFGKPRPAVVVQSDLFNPTHTSLTVCPLTSYLVDAPLFRLPVEPSQTNGLKISSQIMVDKIFTLKIEKVGLKIGQLEPESLEKLSRAMRLWLGLEW